MTARHEDGRLPVSGQYWQAWTPSGPVRGVVVLVHGAHEHSGRYAHVAETLGAAGFAVHAVDHPGHGRSAGTRGNIGSMAQTVAGVDQVARAAQQRHAGAPTFVYGHSLGGLIALQYLTGDPVPLAGAVISAPAVDLSAASAVQIRLAGLLSRLTPNLGVVQLEAAAVSRDPEVVRDYTSDPLNNMGKVRARTGAEMLATVRAMPARVPQLRLPLYLVHGTADRLVPVTATEWLAANTGSADVTVRTWDGLYHEPHNEPERGQVLAEIVDWLQAHLDRPA